MTTNVIEKAGYIASEEQIEGLARDVAIGRKADSTYLRVLVVAVQTALKGKRQRAVTALQTAHEKFYAAVLRGVGADDITPRERTRRATFARTATSTLRSFLKGGGEVRTLDVTLVTKAWLRSQGAGAETVPTGTRYERSAQRAQAQLLRALKRMPPPDARQNIDSLLKALTARRDALAGVGRAARAVTENRARPADRPRSH